MAKRWAVLAASVAVLALTLSIVAPALSNQRYQSVRFTVWDRSSDDERFNAEVNVGGRGFTPGDYIVLQGDPVFNNSFTRRLGSVRGDCLLIRAGRRSASFECDVTFSLGAGRITVEGPLTFAGPVSNANFAVTGGTGRYRAAHGILHARFTDQGAVFNFDLLL
jgi:hypothetical protein